MQLCGANLSRMGLVVSPVSANYQRTSNNYMQLRVISQLGAFLADHPQQHLEALLLQMVKEIPVIPISQGLLVECLIGVEWEKMGNPLPFWSALGQTCLAVTQQHLVSILEDTLKERGMEEAYESYLVQKTLNGGPSQLMSEDMVSNLHKLEPFIHELRPELLKLFVNRDNLPTILKNFKHFSTLPLTYEVLAEAIERDPGTVRPHD